MKKTLNRIYICILIVFVLFISNIYCRSNRYTLPDYAQTDISSTISSDKLSEKDYTELFRQTGLSPAAIDSLRQNGDYDTIFQLQKMLFEHPDIKQNYILYPFTAEERTPNRAVPFAMLHNGDIIVTFNTVSCDWRHGHIAIVVDAKNMIILEHRSAGAKSCLSSAKLFGTYPSFIILRHTDMEIAEKAAQYAKEHLAGIDYNIFAGILKKDKSDEDEPFSSHCSHIVWQAYKAVGIDIDRDKGFIVTPKNIADSEKLRVVQVFGMDTSEFENRLAK